MLSRLRWMRMFGDTLFAVGAMVLGWFVLGLITGHSFRVFRHSPRGCKLL
jgi:nitric oxide reductase subunit B